MDDLISKQQTYEILSDYYHHKSDEQHASLKQALDRVPIVQRWISCSERVPDNKDLVIVSVTDDFGDGPVMFTDLSWYVPEEGIWIINDVTDDKRKVVAWMPFPDPIGAYGVDVIR